MRPRAHAGSVAAIADDSGLEVDALGGAPGIYSARYAGRERRRRRQQCQAARGARRHAAASSAARATDAPWCSCATRIDPAPLIAEGVWEGCIARAPRGSGGFGYDPYFWLPELERDRGGARPGREESAAAIAAWRCARCASSSRSRMSGGTRGTLTPASQPRRRSLALYVHMPWCVRKCPYCDFNSHQLKSAAPDAGYIDALIRDFDAELPRLAGREIDTVFFGGGTPSLFPPEDFARLLRRAAAADRLRRRRGNHAGGQSGHHRARPLRRLSRRRHQSRVARRAKLRAARARDAGPHSFGRGHASRGGGAARRGLENFNLDLMYALPRADARGGARGCAHRLRARARAYLVLSADARAGHGVSRASAAAAG